MAKSKKKKSNHDQQVLTESISSPLPTEQQSSASSDGLAWSRVRIPANRRWTPSTQGEADAWSMANLLEVGRVVIDGKSLLPEKKVQLDEEPEKNPSTSTDCSK